MICWIPDLMHYLARHTRPCWQALPSSLSLSSFDLCTTMLALSEALGIVEDGWNEAAYYGRMIGTAHCVTVCGVAMGVYLVPLGYYTLRN